MSTMAAEMIGLEAADLLCLCISMAAALAPGLALLGAATLLGLSVYLGGCSKTNCEIPYTCVRAQCGTELACPLQIC